MRLSTSRLPSTISRQFPADVLSTVAACSSVERSFLSGVRPAHKSRSYFFFLRRYGLEKMGRNRVIWVESICSLTGQRTTSCVLKTLGKLDSGALLQIHGIGKIEKNDSLVTYVDGSEVLNFRKGFSENLQKLPKPLPTIVRSLMNFEHSLHTLDDNYIGRKSTYAAFSTYVKEVPTVSLWSLLQFSSVLGVEDLLDIISIEIGQRINKLVRLGVEAVKKEIVG